MPEESIASYSSYRAQPTLRIDGQENETAQRLLIEMTSHEAEGGMSSLELVFTNWNSRADGSAGAAFEDEHVFKFGTEIKVYAGEVSGPTEIFRGKVSAMAYAFDGEGAPRLVLQAEDAAHSARLTRRIDVYENKSLDFVAREIAQRMQATPIVDNALRNITGTWVQFNESDLAFLRRLLAAVDADCQCVGNELHVAPRKNVHRNDIELRLHSQLQKVSVVADLAHQVSNVRVTGFDYENGEAIAGAGQVSDLGPGSGRTGADCLQQGFHRDREEQISHRYVANSGEARALAEAAFAQRARGFVRVEGVAEGNSALRVGTHVRIADISPRFDNTYYVTECKHRFDLRKGYRTEFRAESAYLGNAT